jgi:hypothetical protein
MTAFLNSGLLTLIAVAVAFTGGIFLAVAISGVLSAFLTLGLLELFFRARMQRSALSRYFQGFTLGDDFYNFLRRRYGESDALSVYAGQIQELEPNRDILPALAKMDGRTFYQLHYRQLCGQLASVLANEGLRSGNRDFDAPLTDLLSFIAERRSKMRARARTAASPAGPGRESDSGNEDRYYLELAMRQVDVVQAELGSHINRTVYGWTTGLWTATYVTVFTISWVDFALPAMTSATLMALAALKIVVLIAFAFLAGLLLAIGTAVFGGVAFTWLDRVFAAK